ncbi:hypothetical protein [Enterococcus hirae]|uniref:phage terminase small subunit n=1 Tax=Enterococcus hirae TaxID=1354 RepID=UPI00136FEE65|nr:hypothetical protein [Enterococcus hirae]NAE18042.1 hypothetical protein [Enterococcus hirae]
MTTVIDEGTLAGAPLPEGVLPDGEEWHPQTLALWNALRSFPTLADEPALGWQFLIDTALMHHTMWTKGRWEFASEVRLRVAKYGATPEDRMRLKVKVEKPKTDDAAASPSAAVTSIASRRSRLSG